MVHNNPYIYSYVLNNPLKFTDPSGYLPQWVQDGYDHYYENGGAGDFNYFGWMGSSYGSTGVSHGSEGTKNLINISTNVHMMRNSDNGGYWNTSMSRPHFFGSKSEAFNYAVSSNSDITMTAYSGGSLGSQDILYENATTGTATVVKTPFWEITGSYYNELYYFSGLVAYDISTASQSMQVPNLSIGAFHALTINGLASNLQVINRINGGVSIAASSIGLGLANTRLGSNLAYLISYRKILSQGSKLLKPAGHAGLYVGVPIDIYLSATKQQPWSTTGLNSAVSYAAMRIGGWQGLALAGLYYFGQIGTDLLLDGLGKGAIKPNPDMTRNLIPGLAPTPVIY